MLVNYLRYLLFIAKNWDLRLALYVIYYEIIGEIKYGLNTSGTEDLRNLEAKGIDISHASFYMPINFFILGKLMKEITKYPHNKTFLDIGCGKGRAMAVSAFYGFEKIIGIDFSKEFCEAAVLTMRQCAHKFPLASFSVLNNDAFYHEIGNDITTIFLFNPFDHVIMSGVLANILESQRCFPRTIRVLYANPVCADLFLQEGFREVYHIRKMEYLEAIILQKDA